MVRALSFLTVLCAASSAFAYGEPDDNGHPNHQERLLHVLSNQVRAEPHAWAGWPTEKATPDPRKPLLLQNQLFRAARFYADDMAKNGCFPADHSSCDGTSFTARLSMFFQGPSGENIYKAVGDSSARSAITAWMNSDGHRVNLLRPEWDYLGTGFANSNAYLYVQDFGGGSSTTIPAIVSGAAESLSGGNYRFIANYYHEGGQAPQTISVVVDSSKTALEKVAGKGGNLTLQAEAAVSTGCAEVYFETTDGSGKQARFPTGGVLLVGSQCDGEYRKKAQVDDRPIIDANDDQGGCRCQNPPSSQPKVTWLLLGLAIFPLLRRRKAKA